VGIQIQEAGKDDDLGRRTTSKNRTGIGKAKTGFYCNNNPTPCPVPFSIFFFLQLFVACAATTYRRRGQKVETRMGAHGHGKSLPGKWVSYQPANQQVLIQVWPYQGARLICGSTFYASAAVGDGSPAVTITAKR
jgi:hypothetical protein